MRLVRRNQLMLLPEGTLYFEHAFDECSALKVKGKTITSEGQNIDWFVEARIPGEYSGFAFDEPPADLDYAESDCIPEAVGDGCRDGSFDDAAVYAVLERSDVDALVKQLNTCLARAYGGAQ